ncbi:MAG: PaaI family thioesterase [Clostridiales bacterium]|nr:PaaI family thioesterase [Clostridiales bacterium]
MDEKIEKMLKDRNEKNRFARYIGMEVTKVETGYAEAVLPVTENVLNPYSAVHGGAMFTLADGTGGAAATSYGRRVVTLDADFHYLKMGVECKYIKAIAREVRCGRRVMVFRLEVRDDEDALLAEGTFTYMAVG